MLRSKKILFISPSYFNYSSLIKSTLESLGASVDLFSNRPTSLISKFSGVLNKKIYEGIKIRYFRKLLKDIKGNYDYILVIRADLIPVDFLQALKIVCPEAKFIQYVWDDIHLFPLLLDSFRFFDRVLSYDLSDSAEYSLVFRPFFFLEQQAGKRTLSSATHELFFIGSYHTDRLPVLENVMKLNPGIELYSHFYINPVSFILNKIPVRKIRLFNFGKMKYFEMIKTIEGSLAILDIQNVSQHGLTTRIFEALGARSKIVTTNSNIIDYEFYNDRNILIVDRNNPIIEKSWLHAPYEKYDDKLLGNYHITRWIQEVFDIKSEN
jgi:hypothetical protein